MIKKISASIIMIFASMIILVHAVIPHHHHESQVCFELTENHNHVDCKVNFGEHDHDSDQESDQCLLNQVLVLYSNFNRFEENGFGENNSLNSNFPLSLVIISDGAVNNILLAEISLYDFYTVKSFHLKASSALRAPPVV